MCSAMEPLSVLHTSCGSSRSFLGVMVRIPLRSSGGAPVMGLVVVVLCCVVLVVAVGCSSGCRLQCTHRPPCAANPPPRPLTHQQTQQHKSIHSRGFVTAPASLTCTVSSLPASSNLSGATTWSSGQGKGSRSWGVVGLLCCCVGLLGCVGWVVWGGVGRWVGEKCV